MDIRLYHLITPALLMIWSVVGANPLSEPPERRSDQFPTDSGRLMVPLPYSLPGIGDGYFLMGYFTNLFDTTADAFIVKVEGDAEGYVAQFDEVPLIPRHLFLNLMEQRIDRAAVNNYKTRGMATGQKDYSILEVNQADQSDIGVTLSLYERRLEYNATHTRFDAAVTTQYDSSGKLTHTYDPPYRIHTSGWIHSLQLDLTDDYLDPRRGLRFDLHYQDVPADSARDPDYYHIDTGISLYVPFRQHDTLALNYYRSDAHVRSVGSNDPDAVRLELCQTLDPSCLTAVQDIVNNLVKQRTHGTATSLGGDNRLRSYPMGRFSGGHMAFVGAEYRWNFIRDAKPFNYFIWKDVTTSLQLAFFYEAGTVAETSGDLWKEYRSSYGIGGRLVSASGNIYRADLARGNEGNQFTIFFFYPWK